MSPLRTLPSFVPPARLRIGLVLQAQMYFAREILHGIRQFALSRPQWRLEPLSYTGRLEPEELRKLDVQGLIGGFHQGPWQSGVMAAAEEVCPGRVISVSAKDVVSPLPRVTHDSTAVGVMAAEYFLQRGYLHFVYVPDPTDPSHAASIERGEAFAARLELAGARMQVLRLSELCGAGVPPFPAACFCFNTQVARRVIVEARQQGLQIPEDMAVLGVDDDPVEQLLSPLPISTVLTDGRRVGYLAAQRLSRRLEGREDPDPPKLRVSPLGLSERASTDTLAVEDAVLRRVLRLIREESATLGSVEELAQRVGIGRRSLELKFRRLTGRGVGESLRLARLEQAELLLRETDLPIAEVAERAGFSDSRSLSRDFRALLQQTPGAYRREHGRT